MTFRHLQSLQILMIDEPPLKKNTMDKKCRPLWIPSGAETQFNLLWTHLHFHSTKQSFHQITSILGMLIKLLKCVVYLLNLRRYLIQTLFRTSNLNRKCSLLSWWVKVINLISGSVHKLEIITVLNELYIYPMC